MSLDYPSVRRANILSVHLFNLKRGIELNTREFIRITPSQISAVFADHGFLVWSPIIVRADRRAPSA